MGDQRLKEGGWQLLIVLKIATFLARFWIYHFIEILYISYLRVWVQITDMLTLCWWCSRQKGRNRGGGAVGWSLALGEYPLEMDPE